MNRQTQAQVIINNFVRFEIGGLINLCNDECIDTKTKAVAYDVPNLLDLLTWCYNDVVNGYAQKHIRFLSKSNIKELIIYAIVYDYVMNKEEDYYNLFNDAEVREAVEQFKKM